MAKETKHVGKMKNNGAKIAIAYRTLPGDALSALVIGTSNLGDTYHDALMSLLQDDSAQQANELADILAVRRFPDGSNMLEWLHTRGHLKKVPTSGVLVTPNNQNSVSLDELNQLIADQRGVSIDELAVTDGAKPNPKSKVTKKETTEPVVEESTEDMTPAQMRSKADALFKQAQVLRKQADAIDPPKSKKKEVVADVE
jgi:hypothetical protein